MLLAKANEITTYLRGCLLNRFVQRTLLLNIFTRHLLITAEVVFKLTKVRAKRLHDGKQRVNLTEREQ